MVSGVKLNEFSLLDGLTAHEQRLFEARARRLVIPAGTPLTTEGRAPDGVFMLLSGFADVVAAGDEGQERRLRRIGPGQAVGEMAMLTGQPASATVRAVVDTMVLQISTADFHEVAATVPRLYRNLSIMLSHRLTGTNRLAVRTRNGRATLLIQEPGAPPLLGYALACSIAWHTRRPTLLLVLTAEEGRGALAALGGTPALPGRAMGELARAQVLLGVPEGMYLPGYVERNS